MSIRPPLPADSHSLTLERLEPDFTPEEFAELRAKLAAWDEDWNAPGMEVYDDYQSRRPALQAF